MPVPQEPLSVEETTVAPSVRTAIEPLDVGNGIGVNRALAEALAVTHRVEHTLQRARETPPPDPMSASAEEKLLRAIVGEKVAQELPPHLDDSGVARRGEPISRGMLLIKDAGGGDVYFTGAARGEVERVDRVTAGLPKGIAEVVTVVVVWPGALTPGDLVADAAGPIGAVESIVDDGSAAPRLFLGARERERFARTSSAEVTRVLPSAMQRMEARGIGPYSIVSDYPITGERLRAGQLEWLAARGCLALFSDFAWYKGAVVTARTRVYEDLVTRRPIPDPWAELRAAHEYANERPKQAAEPAPASGLRDIFSFFEKPSPDRMIGRSFHTVRALLRVAGVDLALEGHAVRARPAFAADPGDASRGAVVRPETLNYRTRLPEPGGLFCQKIFGPIRDYECACGKYRRMRHRGIVCETCGVEVIASRVRTERFGHVPLPSPVVPIHLRPLLAALLDEDAEAAIATIDADGGEALAARLSGLDPAAIAARYSAGDPRREWVEALARSGVAPEAVLWKHVLVLPPDLRPLIALSGGRWATSDLNDLYRRLINRSNRLRRLIELNAPATIVANERRMLRQAVDQLLVNTGRGAARFGDRTLSSMIPQALGVLRADAARRVDYSGRAVALVAEGAGGRPAKVPQAMLFELFRPILYGLCEEKGYTTTIKSAKALVEKDATLQRTLLAEAIRDRPLLFGAAETGDVLAAGPVEIGDDPVVRLPPEIAARIGVTQGESVVLHVPLCDRAVEEARWLAAAGTTGVLHPVDVAHPSWLASLPDAPRDAAEQLMLGALRGEADPALRPSLAFLIGGYELPEQPTS